MASAFHFSNITIYSCKLSMQIVHGMENESVDYVDFRCFRNLHSLFKVLS